MLSRGGVSDVAAHGKDRSARIQGGVSLLALQSDSTLIDRIRLVLAVIAMVVYGPGLLFWFLVHPFVGFWRHVGPTITYLVVGIVLVSIGVGVFQFQGMLIGRNLGTNWILVIVGAVLFVLLGWLGLYGRALNHLDVAARMGVPELSSSGAPQMLVRDGLYGFVRHPIYSAAIVGGVAYALIVDYLGTFILFGAAVPVLYAITILEERELLARFGEEYRRYQQRVPRLFPRVGGPA
jgi:protein-S-isoprenylcysteine O-methyltransferase Ste14